MSVWEEDDVDCGWAVDDETDDEDDDSSDHVCMMTDARYFVPHADENDDGDSDSEVEGAEDILADSEFDVENGYLETAVEEENRPIYFSPLSAPSNRQMSTVSANTADPWATGLDPWRREMKSSFAD